MALDCWHCSPDGSQRVAARVRYHYSRGALGQLPGADGYGERAENFTTVVYDVDALTLSHGDLLVFESGEVVQVGNRLPRDVRTAFAQAEVAQLGEAVFARYSFLTPGQAWAGLPPVT